MDSDEAIAYLDSCYFDPAVNQIYKHPFWLQWHMPRTNMEDKMNSKQRLSKAGLSLALCLAWAQAYGDENKPMKMDQDGDGVISQAEWDAAQEARKAKFFEMDADGDGYLTREEIRGHVRERRRDRSRQKFEG